MLGRFHFHFQGALAVNSRELERGRPSLIAVSLRLANMTPSDIQNEPENLTNHLSTPDSPGDLWRLRDGHRVLASCFPKSFGSLGLLLPKREKTAKISRGSHIQQERTFSPFVAALVPGRPWNFLSFLSHFLPRSVVSFLPGFAMIQFFQIHPVCFHRVKIQRVCDQSKASPPSTKHIHEKDAFGNVVELPE